MTTPAAPGSEVTLRDMLVARPSLSFALEVAAGGVGDLKPIDGLLVLAVNQANIAPLRRDHDARERYGALETPAKDQERRRVSISAIASSLDLPFETVRQRIRRLTEHGVCALGPEGVYVPASYLSSERYLASVLFAYERLKSMYETLARQDLIGRLPTSNYDTTEAEPIRGAAALVSDYVLRVAEPFRAETRDTVSALMLMALVVEALTRDEAETPPLSTRTLAERLKLPGETVRRHGLALAEAGLAVRRGGGLVLQREVLRRPRMTLLLMQNPVHLKRLLDGLAERGVLASWTGAVSKSQVA
jgi:DNA-binding Lrp family transcriptional regulator